MTDKTSLGDRMKGYEAASKHVLLRRTPTIIRVDGKAFHTWTKGLVSVDSSLRDGPFSKLMHEAMVHAAVYAMDDMQNVQFIYTQSDEISFFLRDWDTHETQQWFGGTIQKIASTTAAMVTAGFIKYLYHHAPPMMVANRLPSFDARVFQLPKEEVANYFIWRQNDASRNSVNMLGRHYFSHKKMHGKSTSDVQDMLMDKHGVNWDKIDTWKKRGSCIYREVRHIATNWKYVDGSKEIVTDVESVKKVNIRRDDHIPIFTQRHEYIEKHVLQTE